MLSNLFLQVLTKSISATVVILLVLIIRTFLKKSPKFFSYLLWSVVLFRLLIPFTIESKFSLVPNASPISEKTIMFNNTEPLENSAYNKALTTNSTVSSNLSSNLSNANTDTNTQNLITPVETTSAPTNQSQQSVNWATIIKVASLLWMLGVILILIKSIIDLIKLKRTLSMAEFYKDNIYFSENISTAFVLGIIKPKIYLPKSLEETSIEYIVKHEEVHIKRHDTLFRFLGFIALSIHWFNPFVWLAYSKSGSDMEMSCDEKVIKELGSDIKKDYSTSLLSLATDNKRLKAIPLAFAENNTKSRIKNVLSYKKPKNLLVLFSVLIVVISFTTLLTSTKGGDTLSDEVNANYIKEINMFLDEQTPNNVFLEQDDYKDLADLISNLEIDSSDNMYGISSSNLDSIIRLNYIDDTYREFWIMDNYSIISISDGESELKSYRILYPEQFKKDLNNYAISCNNNYKDKLYNSKTDYVGAPSVFGNLRSLLPLNKFVTESTFEITNDGGFNGVIWNIETTEDYIDTPELYQSVRLTFALIGNLDRFTINSHNTLYDYTNQYTFTRESFDVINVDSEKVKSGDKAEFNNLIDDIFSEDYYKSASTQEIVVDGEKVTITQPFYQPTLVGSSYSKLTTLPKDLNLNVALSQPLCFIVLNNKEIYNKDIWEQFLKDVENKKGSLLSMVEYTENNDAITSIITYNGTNFQVELDSRRDVTGEQTLSTKTYKNLVTYTPPNTSGETYYYLTNKTTITDEDFNTEVNGLLIYSDK